ncbi:peptide transporter family 1-like [Bradysia coprophila]|uniref:peptide transporter family 1-like n=1 Tax=Bradysia coprophila TaxID=38358 RepID=UPI00187D6F67|nr:peptide transporter family 1-like [Bradysia coprophila]
MDTKTEETSETRRVAKAAIFILFCVLLERYSTAGISSILFLFFNQKIGFDVHESTAGYHTYECLLYLFPVIGGIIADSWLGRYRTMVCMSIIVAIGSLIVAVGVIDAFNLPIKVFSVIGLLVLTFGDACLVTLVPTFGAEQYKSTEVKSIDWFFSLFYIMYNCGSIVSRFISPILREDVKCFGNDDCFPLAFGLPAILMSIVTVLIMISNRFSEAKQTQGTTVMNVLACIKHAIVMKFKLRKNPPAKNLHLLDYSEEKYGTELVRDTQIISKVIVLYLPIIIFWALFYQQGSRWVYQATRMNGDLGFYTIKADQFNVVNPLFVIALIPVFEHILYPLLSKVAVTTALQKATLGGVVGGVSFLVSAIVELQLEDKYLHMTWLIPQYLLMASAEVLVTVPLMNFSYSEAPESMKTILQALFFLSAGLGNLFVVIVAGTKFIESQFYEFVIYAVLMFADIIVFGMLARRYKSSVQPNSEELIENSKFNQESYQTRL